MLLPKAIGYFKMNSGQVINQLQKTQGKPLWQKNYYEHIIRNQTELEIIQKYIVNNPFNWNEDIDNPQVKPAQEEIQFWQRFGRKDL